MSTDSFSVVAAIATAVGVFVAGVTFYYQQKRDKFSQLIEIFKLLNDDKHRIARRVVYQYKVAGEDGVGSLTLIDLGFPKETPKSVIIHEYQEIVIGDFENIGSLISNKLLPKEAFLHAHWTTILYSWAALKDDIIAERKKRGNMHYMENFEQLNILAESYWHSKNPNVVIKLY